ncbi:hypothetical protein J5U23_01443 [Saccharolobus shibatae B12]|uniref:Uncharacterized protein n=1 Tax=Saccharolobus shibatae (strain ATCC 51178 / DSM 5389 / JCM 8931 / NBRC 15437 / B12) TaxID=523848 RepID=A0A8F5GT51_SACSH|nr:hypothetical protein J5U23_01443 [Saccharolobus shibatae B12]
MNPLFPNLIYDPPSPPPTGNSRKTRERVKTSITREKEISKEGEKQHKPMSSKGIKTP